MARLDIRVEKTSTAQQIADGLTDLILAGRFEPGARLRESAIAGDLGVSRNTVREAVRIMEIGGLVRHEISRGAVVVAPTVESVQELYRARAHLETAAVRQPRTDAALEPARTALTRLKAAATTHEVAAIVSADLEFHTAIVGLLDSSRIDQFYRDLSTELRFYLTTLSVADREYDRPESVVAEHQVILEALESGDQQAAVEAIQRHIVDNAERLCEILRSRENPR